MEKILLTVKEVVEYTGICESRVRQIMNNPKCPFTVCNGYRKLAHKKLLDDYLIRCAKYKIVL